MDIRKIGVVLANNVAAPLGRRLGTALAAYLIAKGIPQDMADQFLTACGVLVGLSFDVVMAYIVNRRRA